MQGCFSEQIKLCGNVVLCSGLWYCPYKLHALVTLLGPLHFLVACSSVAFGEKFTGSSGVTGMMSVYFSCFLAMSSLPCLIWSVGQEIGESLRPCKALTLAFVLSEGRSGGKPVRRGLA